VPDQPKSFDDLIIGAKSGDKKLDLESYNNEAFK
jgi:hypothetical protein